MYLNKYLAVKFITIYTYIRSGVQDSVGSGVPEIEIRRIPTLNYLTNVEISDMSRAQFDHIIYTLVVAAKKYLPIEDPVEITALVEGAMSALFQIYHPRNDDPTFVGIRNIHFY